jgi:threonine dehydratase
VPDAQQADFQGFLDALGYQYWQESDNPAYDLFLK